LKFEFFGGYGGIMSREKENYRINIRNATIRDVVVLREFIVELAEFEKLSDKVVATEKNLRATLFGDKRYAYAIIAELDEKPVGFALYFFNYSTFLGRPGLYIEDLYVRTEFRGVGVGEALFKHCAMLAKSRKCGRMEFAVLSWNPARMWYERFGARPLHEWVVYRLSGAQLAEL
jgi:GNAT superfamily N-acetyltransferase